MVFPILEGVKDVYRSYGYDQELDFPDEYYFMHNTKTGKKVRMYYEYEYIQGNYVIYGGGNILEY